MNKAVLLCGIVIGVTWMGLAQAPRNNLLNRGSFNRNRAAWRRPAHTTDELTQEIRTQERVETSRKQLDRLLSMTNRMAELSVDAQNVFRGRIANAQTDYTEATNDLAQIQLKLTPERRAELLAAKRTAEEKMKAEELARKESAKLNAEVDAFERADQERERLAQEAQERAKRDAEVALQNARLEAEKAEREAAARKRAAALEELAGWPKDAAASEALIVYGTNVDKVIASCCPGAGVVDRKWDRETEILLAPLCEKEMNVVLVDNRTDDDFGRRWEVGCGKALVECDLRNDSRWKKYDETGRLVKWAPCSEFAEYVYITNQFAVIFARLREDWAKRHNLTQEQAKKRAQELIDEANRPLPIRQPRAEPGSLRARRMLREQAAREAAEKAKAAEERERQRQRSLAIQEELKKAREAAAAKAKVVGNKEQ